MFVLDWTELESSCQKIAQKSRLHMLSLLLILLRRNPIIWFYIVNTFQTLLPICHVIFLLDCTFPLNRLSHSFCLCRWINLMLCYYTVGVSHYFQPRRWFALTPSISSLWAVASEYFQCGMCWNDPTSDHCTWYRNARVSNQGLACWHKQRRCFGLHSWKLFFFLFCGCWLATVRNGCLGWVFVYCLYITLWWSQGRKLWVIITIRLNNNTFCSTFNLT